MKLAFITFSVYILWFAAVFDPVGNMFQLRYIALAVALPSALLSIKIFKPGNRYLQASLVTLLALIMPAYGILLYSFRGGSIHFTDTSYIAAGILILTTFIYNTEAMCDKGVSAMILTLRLLAFVIIYIYLCMFFDFNYEWVRFFTEANVALISTREYGGISLPYIYFLASPMLLFLVAYEVNGFDKDRSFFRLTLCLLAIFALGLSGTRAHMLLAIGYPAVYFILTSARSKASVFTVGLFGILALGVLISSGLIGEFFSPEEASNELKLSLLDMYVELFSSPLTLLFGQGFNAHEWSGVLREKFAGIEGASKTELTYIELIRVYGLLLSLIFYALIMILIIRTSRLPPKYKWIFPAFVVFSINAAFNPYLFSTNGMLPLGLLLALASLRVGARKAQLAKHSDHQGDFSQETRPASLPHKPASL